MNIRLATVNLEVADPQASKRFYVDLLGMTEDERRSHAPGFVYLRSAGCDLTLAARQGAPAAGGAAPVEIGFEVDDFAAARAHLEAHGPKDAVVQNMGWGEAIELRDPDGHRIVIYALARG